MCAVYVTFSWIIFHKVFFFFRDTWHFIFFFSILVNISFAVLSGIKTICADDVEYQENDFNEVILISILRDTI